MPRSRVFITRRATNAIRIGSDWTPSEIRLLLRPSSCGSTGWSGNYSGTARIGEDVWESRIDTGPGYRVYCGLSGEQVLLLCGGDKRTQKADIRRAKGYGKDHEERNRAGGRIR